MTACGRRLAALKEPGTEDGPRRRDPGPRSYVSALLLDGPVVLLLGGERSVGSLMTVTVVVINIVSIIIHLTVYIIINCQTLKVGCSKADDTSNEP